MHTYIHTYIHKWKGGGGKQWITTQPVYLCIRISLAMGPAISGTYRTINGMSSENLSTTHDR